MNQKTSRFNGLLLAIACVAFVTPVQAGGSKKLGKDEAIYLGCGSVGRSGMIAQVDAAGKILGYVRTIAPAYGLAVHKDEIVAAIPERSLVVRFRSDGEREIVYQDPRVLPAPIALAVVPGSGEIVVADNCADAVMILPGTETTERRLVLRKSPSRSLQNVSIAATKDGHVLFSSGEDEELAAGVFRFKFGPDADLGKALLQSPADAGMWSARVAADPSSSLWATLTLSPPKYAGTLRLFRGKREKTKLHCPLRQFAFSPKGTLYGVVNNAVGIVNPKRKKQPFQRLFNWVSPRIVSIMVAKRMPWPKEGMDDRGDKGA